MKTFQVKQNYGNGSYGFLYVEVDENLSKVDIENKIYQAQSQDYVNECRNMQDWKGRGTLNDLMNKLHV